MITSQIDTAPKPRIQAFLPRQRFRLPPSSFYFSNDGLRVSMEREAYGAEIERAAGHGYNELVEKLQDLLDEEMRGLDG